MGFSVQAKGITPQSSNPSTPAKSTKVAAKPVTPPAAPVITEDKTRSTTNAASRTHDKAAPAIASTAASSHDKTTPTTSKTSAASTASSHSAPASQSRRGTIASSNSHSSSSNRVASGGRLARVTAYWAGEGDYYTGKCLSSTGVHLHNGHCAVDPRIIPYGSVVNISGVGSYVAVDTGSAVISREAAREAAHTPEQREALVIDLFFESRRDGERFAESGPKYAAISWTTPMASGTTAPETHSMIADENSGKFLNKQL